MASFAEQSGAVDRTSVVYERRVLFEEVWREPMTIVAKRYGVSGVALAKMCRKLDVPVPGRGYWAKKAAGYDPQRPSLPPSSALVNVKRVERVAQPKRLKASGSRPAPAIHFELRHAELRAAAKIASGFRVWHGHVRAPLNVLFPDLRVSPALMPRALKILDALVAEFTAQKWEYCLSDPCQIERRCKTWVKVADSTYVFHISESRTLPPHPSPPRNLTSEQDKQLWRLRRPQRELHATGALTLEITSGPVEQRRWNDTATRKIEVALGSFIETLILSTREEERRVVEEQQREAERIRRAREANAREEARRKREREQKRIAAEAHAKEKAIMAQIEGRVRSWQQLTALRGFLAEVEKRAHAIPDHELVRLRELMCRFETGAFGPSVTGT